MPTLVNGGVLVLVLLLLALALVYVATRRTSCTTCTHKLPANPRYWLVNIATGARQPVCRTCFGLSIKYGKHREEPHQ